jgi:hypothetical protein
MSKLSPRMLAAFSDELEQIALEKQAGFLRDVGGLVKTQVGKTALNMRGWPRRFGNALAAAPKDTLEAIKMHGRPVQAITNEWGKASRGMKALTLAGAGLGAQEAVAKQDPMGQNRGRGERMGNYLAGTTSSLITASKGFIPSVATGIGAAYLGGKIGKAFDKRKKPATEAPPTQVASAMPAPGAAPQVSQR